MEAQSISRIRLFNSDATVTYKNMLVTAGMDEVTATALLNEVRYVCVVTVPVDEIVLQFVKEFIYSQEEITWSFVYENIEFSSDCYKILKWSYKGEDHFIFLNREQSETFISDITSWELINKPSNLNDLINNPPTGFSECKNYLIHLGIIEGEDIGAIPMPSDTLMLDETTTRFSSALWFEEIQKKSIILAGLGGIGSYVAFLLSRMKPAQLTLYDDDVVEAVNMAGQLYGSLDIGKYKVDAIASMLENYSGYYSTLCVREKFEADTIPADIMICGFDSMKARKIFYRAWKNHVLSKPEEEGEHCLFIDGRLAAEELQVLCIRGDDFYHMDVYESRYLFDDDEADETLCSYKQTSYMANMIGSIIVNLFTNFVANELADNLRELPFFNSYDGSVMTFTAKN